MSQRPELAQEATLSLRMQGRQQRFCQLLREKGANSVAEQLEEILPPDQPNLGHFNFELTMVGAGENDALVARFELADGKAYRVWRRSDGIFDLEEVNLLSQRPVHREDDVVSHAENRIVDKTVFEARAFCMLGEEGRRALTRSGFLERTTLHEHLVDSFETIMSLCGRFAELTDQDPVHFFEMVLSSCEGVPSLMRHVASVARDVLFVVNLLKDFRSPESNGHFLFTQFDPDTQDMIEEAMNDFGDDVEAMATYFAFSAILHDIGKKGAGRNILEFLRSSDAKPFASALSTLQPNSLSDDLLIFMSSREQGGEFFRATDSVAFQAGKEKGATVASVAQALTPVLVKYGVDQALAEKLAALTCASKPISRALADPAWVEHVCGDALGADAMSVADALKQIFATPAKLLNILQNPKMHAGSIDLLTRFVNAAFFDQHCPISSFDYSHGIHGHGPDGAESVATQLENLYFNDNDSALIEKYVLPGIRQHHLSAMKQGFVARILAIFDSVEAIRNRPGNSSGDAKRNINGDLAFAVVQVLQGGFQQFSSIARLFLFQAGHNLEAHQIENSRFRINNINDSKNPALIQAISANPDDYAWMVMKNLQAFCSSWHELTDHDLQPAHSALTRILREAGRIGDSVSGMFLEVVKQNGVLHFKLGYRDQSGADVVIEHAFENVVPIQVAARDVLNKFFNRGTFATSTVAAAA